MVGTPSLQWALNAVTDSRDMEIIDSMASASSEACAPGCTGPRSRWASRVPGYLAAGLSRHGQASNDRLADVGASQANSETPSRT
jgi:hypothetical protein